MITGHVHAICPKSRATNNVYNRVDRDNLKNGDTAIKTHERIKTTVME